MSYGEKFARRRANLEKLPALAYARHPETGHVIALRRGEAGYYSVNTTKTADQLNAIERVTPEQARAMLAGSVNGWHHPEADVDFRAEVAS